MLRRTIISTQKEEFLKELNDHPDFVDGRNDHDISVDDIEAAN